MNLFSFVDKYGNYTFDEVSFTEVDNIILSMLSYLDLSGIVSSNKFKKRKLKEVGKDFFEDSNKFEKRFFTLKNAIKVFKNIKDTRRYGDLLLYNFVYKSSGESQFGALCIEINKNLIYVSFEGTDHLIGGWREDFMLSYMFPVLSQRRAISYVNKNFIFGNKKIILGGHSKGGNLALVAGMKANYFIKRRIVNIYNNDGPGLLSREFESKSYMKIEDKLIKIVPSYSIVGLAMCHKSEIEVVRSFKKNFYAHDPLTWVVNDKSFERADLNSFCVGLDKKVDEWLKKYTYFEREMLVNALFDIFDTLEIDNLMDLVDNKKLIFKIISETKDFDDKTVSMIKDFFKVIFKTISDVTKEEIKSIFVK